MHRYLLFLFLLLACGPRSAPFTTADDLAIREVFAQQEAAWDRGDIEGFMAGYADTVCFVSRGRMTCGREAVTENYRRNYPDGAAMGDLDFGVDEILPVGGAHAWVTGTWQLRRQADTLSGGFALLWSKEEGGWRIVRDLSH